MSDTAIKIENLRKQYRLGTIGGQTLNSELQSWWARKRGKEDPNLMIGQDYSHYGERFYALDGINLEVMKGEALGIIGGNGAGKSTLLKILSRVTAPTEGDVWIDGRVASMLEVGTGFHGELTGRENIYMNGAILGMTRKEVDEKIESIIDFSECRQFIDTPVKRYSSGMYVKLAFAVASHLDAEIMIMDEVLAVGDMMFQKKCLSKMEDEARGGKTVLYVSHNMSTIRSLCTRCIVLDKGKMVFEGNVEKAISIYMSSAASDLRPVYDVSGVKRDASHFGEQVRILKIEFIDKEKAVYQNREPVKVRIDFEAVEDLDDVRIRVALKYIGRTNIGMAETDEGFCIKKGKKYSKVVAFDSSIICEGLYYFRLFLFKKDKAGNAFDLDGAMEDLLFEKMDLENEETVWKKEYWGNVRLPRLVLIGEE